MTKNLNIVPRNGANSRGIASIGGYAGLRDFTGVVDPLGQNATCINKPASSIPSMFARILFFRTAFESVSITPTATNSVYAKYVSGCLDLLEDLFDRKPGMVLIKWNKAAQLATLNQNPILQTALNTQLNKFLPGVQDIYLIKDNGQIVGGTSPRTVVYTSPNWTNTNNVKMLTTRSPKFREYMYRFAEAFNTNNEMREFNNFINNSKNYDPLYQHTNFAGLWNIASLYATYPPYMMNHSPAIIDNLSGLQLCGRDNTVFSSDFFIDSTLQPFNQANTPLFLVKGIQHGMDYHDGQVGVQINFIESELKNGDQIARQLPGCACMHSYLTPIYFLEDTLLKLPYVVNDKRWANVFDVEGKSCILPLKPMFFKYFGTVQLTNMFSVAVDPIKQTVMVTLNVPVRDTKGTKKTMISVVKEYSFNQIKTIQPLTPTNTPAYTIGVSPFYRSGKHYVIRQDQEIAGISKLEFYKNGVLSALTVQEKARSNDVLSRSCYYEVGDDFDYIRVIRPEGNGVLIPIYKPIGNGTVTYYYGLDFGTTNTHIAYAHTGNNAATSFNSNELDIQVEYLSARGETGDDVLLTTAAREFLPSNHRSEFTFPIRTVVSESGILGVNSKMFSDASIGFRYIYEYIQMSIYNKTLKWDYNRRPADATVKSRVSIFCEELLWIVKNHWMLQNNASHFNLPEIWLTYPLVMGNWTSLSNLWETAYQLVFGQSGQGKIKCVTESLAPCRNIINQGALTTQGILNIDIGGGTTDLQYYCNANDNTVSMYCSVLFAGDDLWGKGYENTGSTTGADINANAFTYFADKSLNQAQIVVGRQTVTYNQLVFSNPKDKIDCLLKDSQKNFANALSIPENNACRKIMYLHYAAIMWHVAKWLSANGVEKLPRSISFTGLASRYLKLLFDTDARFTAFTKKLLNVFSGKLVDGITITINDLPKNVTAEGAALYAQDAANGILAPQSQMSYYLGIDDDRQNITYNNVSNKEESVLQALRKFLEDFNTIGDCNGQLSATQVITLTETDMDNIVSNAQGSFQQMCTDNRSRLGNVTDSLFFWALKDSLWRLREE